MMPASVASLLRVGEFAMLVDARLRVHGLGQTEVQDLHLVVRRDLHVGRLQIAMDDAFFMRGFQRLGNLTRHGEGLLDRHRTTLQPVGERFPLDQLHDEEVTPVGLLHAMKRGDVRMIERGEHPRLAREPGDAVGVEDEILGQHLDGHAASELRVASAIDLAHAAGAERGGDFVDAQRGSRCNGHGNGCRNLPLCGRRRHRRAHGA